MFWFRHWICRHIKIPTETYCKCSTKSLGGRVGGGGGLNRDGVNSKWVCMVERLGYKPIHGKSCDL